jgi:hypothetical protein
MKRIRVPLIIGGVVLLIIGGILFLPQVSSSPGCEGMGACILYFYADD